MDLIKPNIIILYYQILNNVDMIRHIDIKTKINSNYTINVKLQYGKKIIYDYGLLNANNLQRLYMGNQYLTTLNKQSKNIYLVISIPESKYNDWTNIDIGYGSVFCNSLFRKYLVQCKTDNEDVFIEK